jgi:GDSL-like Lipase/Acylhydrolase family/Cellulose binding domain
MRKTLMAVASAAAIAVAAVPWTQATAAAAEPVRIMPLGDSITGSPGCWRALLWNQLQNAGHTGIDFVGTLPPQGCGVAHDGDNEGHGGILGTAIADQNLLPGWLAATDPDIVLMHLGTNDVWSNRSPATILAAFGKLVDQMRAQNPRMTVLVAQILPMNPANCADCAARVVAFNQAIPGWAQAKSTVESPIVVVDQWTGFTTATDTGDGVHPNDAGTRKMADRWYPALVSALGGAPPTTPPATPPTTPPTTPPSTPPATPAPSCSVSYRQIGQWQGGFQGEVSVQGVGRSWTVTLTFPGGQTVSQLWGGTFTQSGNRATITNAPWNGTPPATAGFIGSWSGSNSPPTASCTTA